MLNNKFHKEIQRGLPDPVYFFYSRESIILDHVLKEAIQTVISVQQMDFNYDMYYPSADTQEILDTAFTLPFLASRRLIVIKNFHEFSSSSIDALIPYFKNPCDTTCMFILCLKEPKIKAGIPLKTYSFVMKERDIPSWLRQLAAKKDIEMSQDAAEYLLETVGPDIGLLVMEVEKLALSGITRIKADDVISSVGTTREYIPFHLVDALVAGQKTRAFKILHALVAGRPYDAPVVLGALNWHYMQFYALWEGRGKRPLKMKEITYRNLLKHLPHFKQENFNLIFQCIHDADRGIKTSARPVLTMEILLIKLLQIGART
jgi:DNA polymerase-3 subunit delta